MPVAVLAVVDGDEEGPAALADAESLTSGVPSIRWSGLSIGIGSGFAGLCIASGESGIDTRVTAAAEDDAAAFEAGCVAPADSDSAIATVGVCDNAVEPTAPEGTSEAIAFDGDDAGKCERNDSDPLGCTTEGAAGDRAEAAAAATDGAMPRALCRFAVRFSSAW